MTSIEDITPENYHIHLDNILEIENRSFPSPWSQRAFIQEIENPISHIWVLLADNQLVGYICFWLFDREIQLINIAVHPDEKGKGLGRHLMTRMIETGLSKGSQYIWLEVRISNLPAKRLYHRLGFEEIGRRRGYYRETNEDAIVMVLPLQQKESVRRISN
ncbi:MAG: ribosomal protein S18-alanine N-acetyltransferase [Deltaproteobacteria bacterium]|nr:ribosomal protein S18-alanine N-acetyltransferase [Deltaproteobacteria bacterium]MBW2206424.1 ribosomal protein S18-alanine N-acetyltransferase [Deltaproteobacteria bacterium]